MLMNIDDIAEMSIGQTVGHWQDNQSNSIKVPNSKLLDGHEKERETSSIQSMHSHASDNKK